MGELNKRQRASLILFLQVTNNRCTHIHASIFMVILRHKGVWVLKQFDINDIIQLQLRTERRILCLTERARVVGLAGTGEKLCF